MEIKEKNNKKGIIKAILTVMNFKLGLTELEIEMLTVMLVNKVTNVDTGAREIIRRVMDRNKFGTNNYLKRLKDKKIILQDGKLLFINPNVIKLVDEKEIMFKFEVE